MSSLPPPPKASLNNAPPRAASPAMSSRPGSPNFLSQSTRSRNAVPATINVSAVLSDLDTLASNPDLLKSSAFELKRDVDQYAPPRPAPKPLNELVQGPVPGEDELSKEQAADLAQAWLKQMEIVLDKSRAIAQEEPGQGQAGRIDKVDEWVRQVERGLGPE
ncbi:hypothetical protein JCM3766R1_005271 [Sporobolomyces carnicolor]